MTEQKRKSLVLHIGTPKTGSTAIQGWLGRQFADADRSTGLPISYPLFDDRQRVHPERFSGNGALLARSLLPRNSGFALADDESILGLYRKLLESDSHDRIVLSSEFFWPLSKDAIARIADLVTPVFDVVEIVAFLRRHDGFVESRYQQAVKMGLTLLAPDDYTRSAVDLAKTAGSDLDYVGRLEGWTEFFGKAAVNVAIVGRARDIDRDPVQLMRDVLKIDDSSNLKTETTNRSMSALETTLLRLANSGDLNRRLVPLLHEYRRQSTTELPKFRLRKETVAPLLEIAKRQGNELSDRFALIQPVFSDMPGPESEEVSDDFGNYVLGLVLYANQAGQDAEVIT